MSTDRKRISKNPFKAPSPILKRTQQQKPLNFFLARSKSTVEVVKTPLEDTKDVTLNRVATASSQTRLKTNSLREMSRSMSSFDDDFEDDDLVEINQPVNFKTSKPLRSFTPATSSNSSSASVVDLTDGFSRSAATTTAPLVNQPPKPFKPLVTLATFNTNANGSKSSQPTLNFGGKNVASSSKRPLNPWDQGSRLNKTKNPRTEKNVVKSSGYIARANPGMVLSDEQKQVINIVVRGGESVFYTGSAGTGKSVLLHEIVAGLRAKYGRNAVAVTASTGLAAVNIGGSTINRLSGMGIGNKDSGTYTNIINRKPELKERWRRMKVLIIDEISMLDGSFLDKLEQVARNVRNVRNEPFGGLQLVLTGDFFQLPPVPDKTKPMKFCFQADCWKYIKKTILLHKVFRQADQTFVDILNAVRLANVDEKTSSALRGLSRPVKYEEGIQPTELYSTRNEVEFSNKRRLQNLPGPVKKIIADDIAPDDASMKLLNNTMAVKELELKIGAQVIMLKNVDDTLVNGSVGIVWGFVMSEQITRLSGAFATMDNGSGSHLEEFDNERGKKILQLISESNDLGSATDEAKAFAFSLTNEKQRSAFEDALNDCQHSNKDNTLPVVRFNIPNGGRVQFVPKEDFPVGEVNDDKTTNIARKQVPLLLSWALSIHKSQGQTLNYVRVDLNKVFEAGQVYVALSRAVSMENLQILNFHPNKIRVNPDVKKFYETLERLG